MSDLGPWNPDQRALVGWYLGWGKRGLDVIGAVIGLTLLFPFLGLISVAVRVLMGSPVLYRQRRPGRNEMPFVILKFRTMKDLIDDRGNELPDAKRLTSLGRFLRRTSLDEFPELINVLKGDMSLVGPRPYLMRYLKHFTEEERARFLVRPGITGLPQILGRNNMPWKTRFELDIRYVRTVSLGLDMRILFLTIWRTLIQSGVRTDPGSTMDDLDVLRSGKGGVPVKSKDTGHCE